MNNAALGCLGFFLGALLGAAIGVGAGLAWTSLMKTSCFEGYCGMLVFTAFLPVGALVGAIGGVALAALLGQRK